MIRRVYTKPPHQLLMFPLPPLFPHHPQLHTASSSTKTHHTDLPTADAALRLLAVLLAHDPTLAPRILPAASEVVRASLPLSGQVLGLQATALHVVMMALEALLGGVEHGMKGGVRGKRRGGVKGERRGGTKEVWCACVQNTPHVKTHTQHAHRCIPQWCCHPPHACCARYVCGRPG